MMEHVLRSNSLISMDHYPQILPVSQTIATHSTADMTASPTAHQGNSVCDLGEKSVSLAQVVVLFFSLCSVVNILAWLSPLLKPLILTGLRHHRQQYPLRERIHLRLCVFRE
ncbi:hypothetical protein RHO15_07310 [Utexia brackfieldae]|uniref:hypothetical protein n=1 Tax=Utexia brackfieldae TaxID=3074108 RepID=UPI00370D2AB1